MYIISGLTAHPLFGCSTKFELQIIKPFDAFSHTLKFYIMHRVRIIDATLETPLTQNDEHMSAGNRQLSFNTGNDVIREHETNPDRCQRESNHESIPLKESHFKIDEHLLDIDGAPLQTDKPTQRCTIPRGNILTSEHKVPNNVLSAYFAICNLFS